MSAESVLNILEYVLAETVKRESAAKILVRLAYWVCPEDEREDPSHKRADRIREVAEEEIMNNKPSKRDKDGVVLSILSSVLFEAVNETSTNDILLRIAAEFVEGGGRSAQELEIAKRLRQVAEEEVMG